MNIDVIITDHHIPGDTIPQALAVLNPKQIDYLYPFKELCGCGVALKLMTDLTKKFNASFELIIPASFGPFIGYSYDIEWDEYQ